MKTLFLKRLAALICAYGMLQLCSCALFSMLFEPDIQKEKEERFEQATGHQLLKIPLKEDKLGYIIDNGVFVKKVWGGKIVHSATGQNISLSYKREDFDKIKLFLGDDFSLGPELENVHHVVISLEDIQQYQLVDFQPLIEYMGQENLPLLQRDFVVSMLKVSKFNVTAFQKRAGEFGAEYHPYPMIKLRGSTGTGVQREDQQVGYNIFVGYKPYNGSEWLKNFEEMPKLDVWITQPDNNAIVKEVRARIRGTILRYPKLEDVYRNALRLYIMTRDEYEDQWILQPETRIDTDGNFEGVVRLGTLEAGNGHRYSVTAFATFFEINRDANPKIAFLPFNKGKYVINVKREDNF